MSSDQENKISESFKEIIESISDKIGSSNRSYNAGQNVSVKLGGNKGIIKAISKTKIQSGSPVAVVKGENNDNYAFQGSANQTVISQTVVNDRWEMPQKERQEELLPQVLYVVTNYYFTPIDQLNQTNLYVVDDQGNVFYKDEQDDVFSSHSTSEPQLKILENNWHLTYLRTTKEEIITPQGLQLKKEIVYVKNGKIISIFNGTIGNYIYNGPFPDETTNNFWTILDGTTAIGSWQYGLFDGYLHDYVAARYAANIPNKNYLSETISIVKKGQSFNFQPSLNLEVTKDVPIDSFNKVNRYKSDINVSGNVLGYREFVYGAKGIFDQSLSPTYTSVKDVSFFFSDECIVDGLKTKIIGQNSSNLNGGALVELDDLPSQIIYEINDTVLSADNIIYPDILSSGFPYFLSDGSLSEHYIQNFNSFVLLKDFYEHSENETIDLTFSFLARERGENNYELLSDRLINKKCFCSGPYELEENSNYVIAKGFVINGWIQYKAIESSNRTHYKQHLTIQFDKKDISFFKKIEKPHYCCEGIIFHCNNPYPIRMNYFNQGNRLIEWFNDQSELSNLFKRISGEELTWYFFNSINVTFRNSYKCHVLSQQIKDNLYIYVCSRNTNLNNNINYNALINNPISRLVFFEFKVNLEYDGITEPTGIHVINANQPDIGQKKDAIFNINHIVFNPNHAS